MAATAGCVLRLTGLAVQFHQDLLGTMLACVIPSDREVISHSARHPGRRRAHEAVKGTG